MALFGLLKKKKKKEETPVPFPEAMPTGYEEAAPGAEGIPTDYVLQMQQQGFTNNQIVQSLQREGFEQSQIFDAMAQADTKKGVVQMQGTQMPGEPQQPMAPGHAEYPPPPQHENLPDPSDFEEIAEKIIEEKWHTLADSVKKVTDWKDQTDARLTSMEQSLGSFKSSLDNLQRAIISKIEDYDKNLLSVGTEIKAMEKVFQKVIPTFTENVNELARLTKNIKKKPVKKKIS